MIPEGIETDAEVATRRSRYVGLGQGHVLSRPVTPLRFGDYFAIADTRRYRASRRRRIRNSAQLGMLLVVGAALLDCVWLASFHPASAGVVLALNGTLGLAAAIGYVAIGTFAHRRPEAVLFVVLVVVDLATIALGFADPALGSVADGYLLLFPPIVALVIPWATKVHAAWLAVHFALALAYTASAAGSSEAFPGLLIVTTIASQAGHVANMRARVANFKQTERIRALNREAKRDHERLDRLNAVLGAAANTDELTALGNRLALTTALRVMRSRIERYGECYGVLILDLDRFKAINDVLGHLGGDAVLRAVSAVLAQTLRPGDTAYRYGGEEFVVLVRVAGQGEALAAAERLRLAIDALAIPNPANEPYGHLTMSIGVASIGPEEVTVMDEGWLASADAALYRAKASGRNRCVTA